MAHACGNVLLAIDVPPIETTMSPGCRSIVPYSDPAFSRYPFCFVVSTTSITEKFTRRRRRFVGLTATAGDDDTTAALGEGAEVTESVAFGTEPSVFASALPATLGLSDTSFCFTCSKAMGEVASGVFGVVEAEGGCSFSVKLVDPSGLVDDFSVELPGVVESLANERPFARLGGSKESPSVFSPLDCPPAVIIGSGCSSSCVDDPDGKDGTFSSVGFGLSVFST
mmetsp:Transcript_25163/g.62045  ORF Transcript_25163/g.62045 Transcript_25163/m.62045 type:complete len:225 (-) Transcript_25163:797-1471(-)